MTHAKVDPEVLTALLLARYPDLKIYLVTLYAQPVGDFDLEVAVWFAAGRMRQRPSLGLRILKVRLERLDPVGTRLSRTHVHRPE